MNLTKSHKEAIVRAVIADIPRKHTVASIEAKLQKITDAEVVKLTPKAVGDMWLNKELRHFIEYQTTNPGYMMANDNKTHIGSLCSVRYPRSIGEKKMREAVQTEFEAIIIPFMNETAAINEAEINLKASLHGIRTLKQFKLQYPELEKYAPSEHEKSSMLPAIANVMATLSNLGWPKDAQQA